MAEKRRRCLGLRRRREPLVSPRRSAREAGIPLSPASPGAKGQAVAFHGGLPVCAEENELEPKSFEFGRHLVLPHAGHWQVYDNEMSYLRDFKSAAAAIRFIIRKELRKRSSDSGGYNEDQG